MMMGKAVDCWSERPSSLNVAAALLLLLLSLSLLTDRCQGALVANVSFMTSTTYTDTTATSMTFQSITIQGCTLTVSPLSFSRSAPNISILLQDVVITGSGALAIAGGALNQTVNITIVNLKAFYGKLTISGTFTNFSSVLVTMSNITAITPAQTQALVVQNLEISRFSSVVIHLATLLVVNDTSYSSYGIYLDGLTVKNSSAFVCASSIIRTGYANFWMNQGVTIQDYSTVAVINTSILSPLGWYPVASQVTISDRSLMLFKDNTLKPNFGNEAINLGTVTMSNSSWISLQNNVYTVGSSALFGGNMIVPTGCYISLTGNSVIYMLLNVQSQSVLWSNASFVFRRNYKLSVLLDSDAALVAVGALTSGTVIPAASANCSLLADCFPGNALAVSCKSRRCVCSCQPYLLPGFQCAVPRPLSSVMAPFLSNSAHRCTVNITATWSNMQTQSLSTTPATSLTHSKGTSSATGTASASQHALSESKSPTQALSKGSDTLTLGTATTTKATTVSHAVTATLPTTTSLSIEKQTRSQEETWSRSLSRSRNTGSMTRSKGRRRGSSSQSVSPVDSVSKVRTRSRAILSLSPTAEMTLTVPVVCPFLFVVSVSPSDWSDLLFSGGAAAAMPSANDTSSSGRIQLTIGATGGKFSSHVAIESVASTAVQPQATGFAKLVNVSSIQCAVSSSSSAASSVDCYFPLVTAISLVADESVRFTLTQGSLFAAPWCGTSVSGDVVIKQKIVSGLQAAITSVVTTTTTVSTVAGAVGGSSSSDAQMLVILSMMSCASPAEKQQVGNAAYLVSPFYFMGAWEMAVGNILMCVCFAVIHGAATPSHD